LLEDFLYSVKVASASISTQLIVVDNASSDGSAEFLRNSGYDLHLIENDDNLGFGRAVNQALHHMEGKYLLLLNVDAFIAPDSFVKTIDYLKLNKECGILGVKLTNSENELQPSCRYFPTSWNIFLISTGLAKCFKSSQLVDNFEWDHETPRACDWVPGCFFLVRRQVIDDIGSFDPRYYLYYEEIDYCFAAKRAGWEVHYVPVTTVVHLGGESSKSKGKLSLEGRQLELLNIESELLYFRKNHGLLGLVKYVFLETICRGFLIVKAILKGRMGEDYRNPKRRAYQIWSLLFKTHLGVQPTR
jgi:GT2 family glycosyltransferase